MIKKGLPFALLLAGTVQAQVMDEIILLKDGTELQGSIIEQDYTRGRYIVRLNDGGTVAVKKKSVKSIRRVVSDRQPEPVAESTYHNDFNQLPATSAGASNTANGVRYIPLGSDVTQVQPAKKSRFPKHGIRIGTFGRSVVHSNDDGYVFAGFNLGYQYNFTQSLGVYAAYNQGEQVTLIQDGVEYEVSGNVPKIQGFQIALNLANRFTKGFQLFGGVGMFKETIEDTDGSEFDATGASLHGGVGYSWQPFELTARLTLDKSNDWEDSVGSTANIQLGFAF